MTLEIYGHPFAAFCWKVYIAARERGVDYTPKMVDADHPENTAFCAKAAPTGQFPILVDGDRTVIETAAIIEYLDLNFGDAPSMVPSDPRDAIEARQMDCVFDDYVAGPMSRLVFFAFRPDGKKDPTGEEEAKSILDRTYGWLNRWMDGRAWAACDCFGIADCAAAPALFYAHWAHPIPNDHSALHAYRKRLLERSSIAATVEDARYFRENFPFYGVRDPD